MLLTLLALMQTLLGIPAAAAPTTPPVQAASLTAAQPPVTITVTTESHGRKVAYRTTVQNAGPAAITTTVTQQLPAGTANAAATDGGGVRGGQIHWTAKIPGGGTVILHSTATEPRPDAITSVCVLDGSGAALDCASSGTASASLPPLPLWRRISLWAAGLLAVGVLVWSSPWLWRPRPPRRPKPARTAVHRRARRDPAWTAAGLAVAGLLGALAVVLLTMTLLVRSAVAQVTDTRNGGWSGTQRPLALGEPVSDDNVEFTVYQAACVKGQGCTVVAAVRNTSGREQLFYRSMQRLYTAPGTWVTPDNADSFFAPLPSGQRRLAALHFPLPASQNATRVELRESAFARGVYYDLS